MKRVLLILMAVFSLGTGAAIAQEISGRVLDETGQGLPGAGITVKGTSVGTVADLDGNFGLTVPEGSTTLVVQAVGYNLQEVPVSAIVSVRMQSAARELTGAVVTALAIRREKREIGYAATTISANELNSGNNVSALSAIQGKTPGVNITSTTGGPGGSTRVVLRGEKSLLGNNAALIVVDGIIVNNSSRLAGVSSLEQIDFGNRGNDVNPDDIESITVLKGPAAAALYGSQGANGALMITTKSGSSRKKKLEVTASSNFTVSEVLRLPKFQNQFGQGNIYAGPYPNDPRENFSWGPEFDGQVRPWGQMINGQQQVKPYVAQPDNVKSFFNKGTTSENNVSLGSGNETSDFYLSLNSTNYKGIIPNTFYNKYSIRMNGSSQLSNKIYANVRLNYLNINQRTEASGQSDGAVTSNLYQTARDIPIWEGKDLSSPYNSYGLIDGTGVARYGYFGAYADNPYWLAANYDNRIQTNRMIGTITVGVKPTSEFDIFNRIGGDVVSDRYTLKSPKYNFVPFDDLWADNPKTSLGGYSEISSNSLLFNDDLIGTYKHQFNDNFGINALVGANLQLSQVRSVSGTISTTNGLVIPGFYNLSNGQGPVTSENSLTESRSVGLYGSLQLSYQRQLFLELTGRNDWSSTLTPGNWSFFYPSANVSWIFTENLKGKFKDNILSYGKIRGGVSGVGAATSAYYNNNPGYTTNLVDPGFGSISFPFRGQAGFTLQNFIGNPGLRPERTTSWEAGVELSLLKNRVTFEGTYYIARTSDQIARIPAPPSTGFTSQTLNLGDVENKGIELGLRVTPVATASGFRWEVFGTFTRNRNRVYNLPNDSAQIALGGFSGLTIAASEGQPYGAMYGIDVQTNEAGQTIIDTNTGLPLRTSTTIYQGSFQPRFMASWGTTLRYKGLSFNVLFDTKQGGKFYSHTKRNLAFNGTSQETTVNNREATIWPNSVYANGDGTYTANTTHPYLPYDFFTNDAQTISGIHVLDASYVKLREASLYWDLPGKWFNRTFLGSVTVGVYGNNLFLWTPSENQYVDPEMNSGGSSNEQGFEYEARQSIRNYGATVRFNF